jgi:hypothetical protein
MATSITKLRTPRLEPQIGQVVALEVDRAGSAIMLTISRRSTYSHQSVVYDVSSGKVLLEAENVALLPSGRRALAGATGEPVVLVDLDTGERRELERSQHSARPLGDRIAWSLDDNEVVSWDLATCRRLASVPSPPRRHPSGGAHRPSFAAATPLLDGRSLAWLDVGFRLHILDLEAGASQAVIAGGPRELPSGLLVAPDGKRAIGTGSKGAQVLFDVEAGSVIAKRDKSPLPARCAWLADGRLVVEGRFLDVVDPESGKRRTIAGRDPNREPIAAIVAAGGATVLVLLQRIADPKQPSLAESTWEAWNVDTGKRQAALRADGAEPPIRSSEKRLFCVRNQTGDDWVARSSWMGFALRTSKPTTRTKPAPRKAASARPAAAPPRGRARGRGRSALRRPRP